MTAHLAVLNQHLIDPEICIRCNTCEETCPIDAIVHDANNYVVKAEVCNGCMACVSPCPTGAIDSWRQVLRADAYSIEDQFTWQELPAQGTIAASAEAAEAAAGGGSGSNGGSGGGAADASEQVPGPVSGARLEVDTVRGSNKPPWSAAHPYLNLYTHKTPVTATVAGNYRLTADGTGNDVRHIVLDFGPVPFPVLEGQSIAVLPPGNGPDGRPHHARQYSIASPRNGERPGYNNLSLTVKRVEPEDDRPAGVCSNYLCDLKKGDKVQVIGPFGATFLMPNHPSSNLLMICTGTGSAPMRAMTEYRRRRRARTHEQQEPARAAPATAATGKLMLFFGARTKDELPYFGPLTNLPKDFIDTTLAFSRTPGQPKRYVQDAIRERAADVAALLRDDETYIYVCGVKGMEDGVVQALADVAAAHGIDWEPLRQRMKDLGRLHFETY